jgi:hypothetical protein
VGCNLLGYGTTSGQIANQARVFAAEPAIRARLNTVYIFSVFAGGAVGSAVAGICFSAFGWPGVVGSGLGFLLFAAIALTWSSPYVRRRADTVGAAAGAVRESAQDLTRVGTGGRR